MYNPTQLQPGQIILVEPGGWLHDPFGQAIACATGSPFSHSAAIIDTSSGPQIIEALWHVTCSPLAKYQYRGWAYSVAGITPEQIRQISAWALSKVGTPYGVNEFWEDIRRYVAHTLPRPHPLKRWTCSGFVAAAMLQAGIVLTQAPYPAPSDLGFSPLLIGPRPWGPTPFPGGVLPSVSSPPSSRE
ncbi:MAG: hypothetical protein K6U87_10295 [Firmicutes bacterium]|nr:hypothetical protein [Bacillota bacterium]